VAAPPTVSWPGPAAAAWLQYLVPLLGGAGSLAFLFAVPGPRHPLLVVAVAGTAVASLALGVALRLHERRTARRARRRERSRYLAHLAQVAAAADRLATAQLAAADHLHPDPPRLWTLVCRAERLWERRPADGDFLSVRVGRGPVPLHAPVRLDAAGGPLVERDATLLDAAQTLVRRAAWLPEAPVTVPLRRLGVLALTGPRDRVLALARALLCQLAALHAPDDLRILAAFPPAALPAWEWLMRVYTIYLLASSPELRQRPDGSLASSVWAVYDDASSSNWRSSMEDQLVAPGLLSQRPEASQQPHLRGTLQGVPRLHLHPNRRGIPAHRSG
jgi:S-DNA-T family DNA segregation ATPase FtsK/SpoIIIE